MKEDPNDTAPPQFPYAYLITAICFSIQALGVGTYISFGVFFNPLMEEFGWSRAAIAGAASAAFFSMGIFGVMIGRLNDIFGPRRLMPVAALLLGLGCVLMGRLTTLWELYLDFGIIFGMGLSAIDVIALTTIARWFSRRRGFMTGIVKVGTGAGQFAIPLAASGLTLLYRWRWTIAIIGSVVAFILVLMAPLLHRDPSALGVKTMPPTDNCNFPAPATVPSLPLSRVFRTLQFWTICLLNLFLVFGLMVIMLHIVPHVRDSGIPPIQAAAVLSTIGAVSMLGRFVSGLVIDQRGSKTVMTSVFFFYWELSCGCSSLIGFGCSISLASFTAWPMEVSSPPSLLWLPNGSASIPMAPSSVLWLVSGPLAVPWALCSPDISSTSAAATS